MWTQDELVVKIDHLLFSSIDGVPQLKIERLPQILMVRLESEEEETIELEGLFVSDTVAHFIEKLQKKITHLNQSSAIIKQIQVYEKIIEIDSSPKTLSQTLAGFPFVKKQKAPSEV